MVRYLRYAAADELQLEDDFENEMSCMSANITAILHAIGSESLEAVEKKGGETLFVHGVTFRSFPNPSIEIPFIGTIPVEGEEGQFWIEAMDAKAVGVDFGEGDGEFGVAFFGSMREALLEFGYAK